MIFFCGYVPEVVVPSYAVGFIYGYIPGQLGIVSFIYILCSLMMCVNNQVHYGLMVVFVCLHITLPYYHHYADVSEGIELLKCLSDTFCRMCLRLSQFSQLAVCIQLTHFSNDDCEKMCTLCYYRHQIGSITHLQLFRAKSWNNGMHCMLFCNLLYDTLQTTFSNAFFFNENFVFWLKFHWKLFPWVQLMIFHHWFRQWLGSDQATSHYDIWINDG